MKTWIVGGIGLAIGIISMALFGSLGSSGEYQVEIHSGSVNYVFPLKYLSDQSNAIVCKPEGDVIAIEIDRDGKKVRALQFCGTVEFKTAALKQVSYSLKTN